MSRSGMSVVSTAGGRAAPGATRARVAEQVEPLLESLIGRHEALLDLAEEHRAAIRDADASGLSDVIARTTDVVGEIARLDEQRAQLAAQRGGDPRAAAGVPLTELAQSLTGEQRDRVMAKGERLRGLIERVRAEHQAIRLASESLLSHMQGLMKQVSATLSHAGTYGSSGSVAPVRQQVVTGIDVQS